jgi:hypothetical protein
MEKEVEAAAQEAWDTSLGIGTNSGNLELSNRPYLSLAFA